MMNLWRVLSRRRRRIDTETVDAVLKMAESINYRDTGTYEHCRRVADRARELATRLGLSSEMMEDIVLAARVHDIGKIGISDAILLKQGPLTAEERQIMQEHPVIGANILSSYSAFQGSVDIVRHHHERWDGKGCPDGLKGEEIPLGSRIIAVVGAYDAMTADQPYRKGMNPAEAVERLRAGMGSQFDLEVCSAFIELLTEEGIHQPAGPETEWLPKYTESVRIRPAKRDQEQQERFAQHDDVPIAVPARSMLQRALAARRVLGRRRRRIDTETVEAVLKMAESIDYRDTGTYEHSRRLVDYSRRLAASLDLLSEQVKEIELAARVHDLGKIGISNDILLKPGPLTPQERRMMEEHPVIGADILSRYSAFEGSVDIVRHHHERWDRKGYPDGLEGKDIPLGSRIISVVDAFDAMTADRPYRKGMSVNEAVERFKAGMAAQFDPQVCAVFVQTLIDDGTYQPPAEGIDYD